MASLTNSFHYGSVSSSYSVRDAIASYRRAQYYPSSNVQSSDLSETDSDGDDLECGPDGIERPPHRGGGITPATRDDDDVIGPSEWDIPTRPCETAYDLETCPLLKKPSFMAPSAAHSGPVGYESAQSGPSDQDQIQPSSCAPELAVHVGRSTYGQTLFNCIAVLLGIGMLSEPLAFAYAGWFLGTVLIVSFGYITCYTAKLLAHEIMVDPRLRSYTDVGRKAFGQNSTWLTNSLFCLELFSLSVAFITLSADSLHSVWPVYPATVYKISFLLVLAPTLFMPLSSLSYTSLLGIISTTFVVAVMFIDGFSKSDSPGSLWSPAPTSIGPGTLGQIGMAFGLFMAGLSGHVVIPALARDMIDPSQFDGMANWAFAIATFVYAAIGCAGYLMFGSSVNEELSRSLLATPGYNPVLNQLAMWALVITPLTKFALSTRPLNIILEITLGLDPNPLGEGKCALMDISPVRKSFVALERFLVPVLSVAVSILIPEFSALMAFLGSFSAFVVCVIGPIAAKIAIRGRCGLFDGVVLAMSIVMAIWGTLSAFWVA